VIVEPIPIGQAAKDYLNLYVTPTLLEGLTELCKQKPADPFVRNVFFFTYKNTIYSSYIKIFACFETVNILRVVYFYFCSDRIKPRALSMLGKSYH
jgi:hypothetical protein